MRVRCEANQIRFCIFERLKAKNNFDVDNRTSSTRCIGSTNGARGEGGMGEVVHLNVSNWEILVLYVYV